MMFKASIIEVFAWNNIITINIIRIVLGAI